MTPQQSLLASARVADLRRDAADLAAATRPAAVVLTRDPVRDRRRLLALLAHERARSRMLVELLKRD
jgi:hypothetical protein